MSAAVTDTTAASGRPGTHRPDQTGFSDGAELLLAAMALLNERHPAVDKLTGNPKAAAVLAALPEALSSTHTPDQEDQPT
jgi:hypothetical protein